MVGLQLRRDLKHDGLNPASKQPRRYGCDLAPQNKAPAPPN